MKQTMTIATAGATRDFFELFGLPDSYDIDLPQLSSRYRKLQATVHPDKFASASDLERRLSVQNSALINEAYQTLRHPLSRAQYMLQLRGADLSTESSAPMDPEFLMQQMRLREELERVRSHAQPMTLLDEIAREIDQALAVQISAIKILFSEKENPNIPKMTDLVRRMQFMYKLQQDVLSLEEEYV